MRTLTQSEKRTLRLAGVGIAIYLAAFGGIKVWKFFEKKRADYRQLVTEAQNLRREVQRYDGKIAVVKKLMEGFHMDPAKLTRATVVAEASAAIQKAATSSGVQLGPVRESPARPSSKELASIQFEGSGPVQAAMGLLNRMETCGYPLIIDSAQITADPMRPGQIKISLTIVILDFDQQKNEEAPHA
jgi:hypothetical protein